MSIADAFKRLGIGKIRIVAGGIYSLRDSVIKLPDGDLAGNRTKHEFRTVLVLSNQNICNSIACPVVSAVPLSSRLTPRAETDLIIGSTPSNSLASDSRIMFGYIQPVCKCDFEKQVGQLNEEEWHEIMGKIVWNFDR
jgi:mRNA-degrading endonuclease toxin of MazEF toxin-antitoxin module